MPRDLDFNIDFAAPPPAVAEAARQMNVDLSDRRVQRELERLMRESSDPSSSRARRAPGVGGAEDAGDKRDGDGDDDGDDDDGREPSDEETEVVDMSDVGLRRTAASARAFAERKAAALDAAEAVRAGAGVGTPVRPGAPPRDDGAEAAEELAPAVSATAAAAAAAAADEKDDDGVKRTAEEELRAIAAELDELDRDELMEMIQMLRRGDDKKPAGGSATAAAASALGAHTADGAPDPLAGDTVESLRARVRATILAMADDEAEAKRVQKRMTNIAKYGALAIVLFIVLYRVWVLWAMPASPPSQPDYAGDLARIAEMQRHLSEVNAAAAAAAAAAGGAGADANRLGPYFPDDEL